MSEPLSQPQPSLTGADMVAARARHWLDRARAMRADLDACGWTVDLADDIGSARWFRGLGGMLGLSLAALSFWPDFTAIVAAPAMPLDAAARDEFRSQMIAPLALGADSGRRMGPSALVVPLASAPERPLVQLTATFSQGDSFYSLLQRAGASASDADRAAALVAGTLPPGGLAPGTQIDITL